MTTMKPTLLILAAGMASRYGSRKQTEAFGPHGETIIDYSIYDAIQAGFGKIVFVIGENFSEGFQKDFESKLKGRVQTAYVTQSMDLKKYGLDINTDRSKPWGTGHAVLSAREAINEPFCVINADDFYGAESFQKMADFLTNEANDQTFSLVNYKLDKTISENGSVSRGVCSLTEDLFLSGIKERTNIYKKENQIVFEEEGIETPIHPDTAVSMNFWGFTPVVFDNFESLFKEFAVKNQDNPKSEFYLPSVVEYLIDNNLASVKAIPSDAQWFGLTYKEDSDNVMKAITSLVKDGTYPEKLWN
jgi:NDP-sugar pyrophosphorylase family protein